MSLRQAETEPRSTHRRSRVNSPPNPEQHEDDDSDDSAHESLASSSFSSQSAESLTTRGSAKLPTVPPASPSPLSPSSTSSASPTPSSCSNSSSKASSKRWLRKEKIGQGAQGSVYRCEEVDTGRELAAKIIRIQDLSPAEIEAIKREVRTMKRLEHRYLVRYVNASEKKRQKLIIYMEYVAGGSLSSHVKRDGALPMSLITKYTRQLCEVLQFLHANRIAHRDIKCANIFVSAAQQCVKLGDFGAFKEIGSVSLVGGIKGTPHWMAPEVIREQQTSEDGWLKADIWSLGCAVLEMLTGHSPWQQYSNPLTAMYQIVCSSNIPTIPADASEETSSFLTWCLQREPANRPTAAQLLAHPFLARESSSTRRKSSTTSGAQTNSTGRRKAPGMIPAAQRQQKLQLLKHNDNAKTPGGVTRDSDNNERSQSVSEGLNCPSHHSTGAPAVPSETRKRSIVAHEPELERSCLTISGRVEGAMKASRIPRLKPLELVRGPHASTNQRDDHDGALSPVATLNEKAAGEAAPRSRSEVLRQLPRLRPKAPPRAEGGSTTSPMRLRRISTAPTPPSELKAGDLLALGRDKFRLPPLLSARTGAGT